jgi:predicted  nucleic acid-binding Zn-ribbon protein
MVPYAVVLVVVLALAVGLATSAVAQTAPKPDPLADADRAVEQLRRQADAASAQYFTELTRFATLDRAVSDLETRIPALEKHARSLRAQVQRRAVVAYEHSNSQLAALIEGGSALDVVRRAKLLDQLNARDDALFESLNASLADLSAKRDELRTERQAESDALAAVRKQGDAINATLTAAVTRQRSLQAAAAAAATAAAATTTTTSTTIARQSSPTTPKPARATPPTAPPSYTPTPGVHPHHDDPFLVCTRARESSGNYTAFNPAGPYLGAYQMLQATWTGAANQAGRTDLIGVPANTASQYDQDDVAWALYQWQGKGPWGGAC